MAQMLNALYDEQVKGLLQVRDGRQPANRHRGFIICGYDQQCVKKLTVWNSRPAMRLSGNPMFALRRCSWDVRFEFRLDRAA